MYHMPIVPMIIDVLDHRLMSGQTGQQTSKIMDMYGPSDTIAASQGTASACMDGHYFACASTVLATICCTASSGCKIALNSRLTARLELV